MLEAYLGREAAEDSGPDDAEQLTPSVGQQMLAVDGLITEYGPVRAVDDVSLEGKAGTVTSVLGANGAGKTSLLRTICGLVRPAAGQVTFAGTDITRMAVEEIVRRTGLAHVPEGRGVIAELTVEEPARLGAPVARWPRGGAAE